jgi:hypothetical protein
MREEQVDDCDVQNADEVEDLPSIRPEDEEVTAAEEEHNVTEAALIEDVYNAGPNEDSVHDPNGRMPQKLPTEVMFTSVKLTILLK